MYLIKFCFLTTADWRKCYSQYKLGREVGTYLFTIVTVFKVQVCEDV